jgi:hypothetical protein
MQETRVNKVSRRFYIDHAGDHAVIRPVDVAKDVQPRPAPKPAVVAGSKAKANPARERRLSKLVSSTMRRPRSRPQKDA